MRKTLVAAAVATMALGFPAQVMAAPTGPGSGQDTVDSGPLVLCTVEAVRPGDVGLPRGINRMVLQPVYPIARC